MKDRKAEALAAAQACAELLRTRFGARRVVIFGSLVGEGPWHDRSDIDLAVEGLAGEDFFAAYSACCDLLPPGLELDLVPLEDAYPEMRARILGEVEMPKDPISALKGLIEDELTALERVAQEMEDLLGVCAQPPTRTELRAMASMLHEFYNGVERIFQRIATHLGEGVPRGEYWHVDLLNQMAEEQEGIRPAVLDERLQARLRDYLDFRHFFRHAYGYTLEWVKIRPLAEGMPETLEALREQLMAFLGSLKEP
ncbi:MAG: nucleotidyltransferase family protein [Anaerolineae bacterium]|jgi:predicted nucleotidyltransferase